LLLSRQQRVADAVALLSQVAQISAGIHLVIGKGEEDDGLGTDLVHFCLTGFGVTECLFLVVSCWLLVVGCLC